MTKKIKYIVITPARDESRYIEKTIISVIKQTIQPAKWIIVNDGSIDETGHIIDTYSARYGWIIPVHRKNRGFRSAGGGVIEAFYDGYRNIGVDDWDYIVKLDGDLQFEADYFERCFNKFEENKKLGIGGGDIYNKVKNREVREKNPIFHVRGATKIYTKECWERIGCLIKAPGWDTLDEVKANQQGFSTKTFTDIKIVQLKSTGSAYGPWKDWVKNGRANYVSCYHPVFILIKCVRRIFSRPFFIASAGLFWGFVSGYIYGVEQMSDQELKKYIQSQQLKKISFRKTIWK
jgi:glycosyltransferase involved in cell wall biosynthesis